MKIRGVTYKANQLEKVIRLLAEEYGLRVELYAFSGTIRVDQHVPTEYRCLLYEDYLLNSLEYIGDGKSLFKALSMAVENYFLGESQS